MTFLSFVLLFFISILAGALNSVAGGAVFLTVPTLIFSGIPPVLANATSTVGLWPGAAASIGAYRKDLAQINRGLALLLVGTSLIGGILGAILLLRTPQTIFVHLLPYLLLVATVLFGSSGLISKKLYASAIEEKNRLSLLALSGISLAQFIIAIYVGYFGGGGNILMLAALGLMGMKNIHAMNALKVLLNMCINGVAVITFIIAQAVIWPQAISMTAGTIIGGYGGAYFARSIEQKWIRSIVIVVGFAMTIYFFLRS